MSLKKIDLNQAYEPKKMNFDELKGNKGFSSVYGNDEDGFVLLTDKTSGVCGRRIMIAIALAPKFKAMVKGNEEDFVLHQISQLAATAGSGSAFSSTKYAHKHISLCGDMRVSYEIIHYGTGNIKSGGVYYKY